MFRDFLEIILIRCSKREQAERGRKVLAMKKMCLRKTVCFLLVLSMIAVLAGCGGDPTASGSRADADNGIDGSGNMDPVSGDVDAVEADGAAAMGRYVEKELDLTE